MLELVADDLGGVEDGGVGELEDEGESGGVGEGAVEEVEVGGEGGRGAGGADLDEGVGEGEGGGGGRESGEGVWGGGHCEGWVGGIVECGIESRRRESWDVGF